MRIYEYLDEILRTLNAEESNGVPTPSWRIEEYLKDIYDAIRSGIYPSDEQVAEAIDAWLDDHPEATTTVQDGSITNAKLASSFVTPGTAAAYSSSATYAVGDYVFYDGALYRCTTPITTAEAWTAAHWTAAVLGDDVGDLKGALKGIIDTKNDFLWVKGSWSGGTLYTSGNAFLKRRATANVIQLNADGIIGIKDTSTYRYGVSFYDSNGDFVRETAWLQAPISVPKNTKITINIRYNDESSASPTDPLKNNLWDTLYICAEDSFASLKNDFMKASANTNNLLKVTNVDANNIEFIALDLGQDVTFPDGVVFSFFANNLVPISTSNAVVDLRKSDGTHQYCAFNNCLDRYDNRFPSNAVANGRYYTDPSVYGAGVTFRYVEIRKASTSGFLSDFMLTAGQNRMQEFVEAKSAIDYEARNKLNISAGEKSYQYDGDEIKLRRNGYNVGALFYSKTMPSEAVSIQDFAIYNNVLFQFYANDIVRLINIENGEEIATYSIQSGHGDTACFSNEFYASGDEFPLLYITAETNKPSFYVNRVTRSGSELIATYYWGGWSDCGYFPGCCIDGRVLWLVGYKEPSYSDATNNEMIVSAWDLDNCVENGDGTLTPSLIKTFNVPFFTTAQGQSMMDGKIFVVSSRTSNPYETKIYVIDTESEKISSVVNNVPTYISEHEAEGIDFLFDKKSWNYDMIVSTPNIYYKLVF